MKYYEYTTRYETPGDRFWRRLSRYGGTTALIVFGLLLGASCGFWVAVRTIPLPNQTVIYLAR